MHIHTASDLHCVRTPLHPEAEFPSAGRMVIQPVVDRHQQRAANMLIRRMYAWRGYLTAGMSDHVDDPNRIALAVWQDDELIATLAIGRDSRNGLLAETLYADEVRALRGPGRTLCEFSRLAVDPGSSSRQLLAMLFSAAQQHARVFFGATDALIEVNPRHAGYYAREFGFVRVGEQRLCPRVDAPAVLMHRDIPRPTRALS